jgi:hypothetical protein
MFTEWHLEIVYWGLPVTGALIAGAWVCWIAGVKLFGKPSYEDLVEELDRLNGCVAHWKYPDGSFVPQHKRQRMFGEMRKLSRQIRNHPKHRSRQEPATPAS